MRLVSAGNWGFGKGKGRTSHARKRRPSFGPRARSCNCFVALMRFNRALKGASSLGGIGYESRPFTSKEGTSRPLDSRYSVIIAVFFAISSDNIVIELGAMMLGMKIKSIQNSVGCPAYLKAKWGDCGLAAPHILIRCTCAFKEGRFVVHAHGKVSFGLQVQG